MDCLELEVRLEAWIDGTLEPETATRVEAHAAHCPECADLLRLGSLAASRADGKAGELVRGVVERTSGAGCARAERLLPAWLDGEVAGVEADLVAAHVAHCGACGAFARVLRELSAELPALAEVAPPEGFVAEVLARTSRRAPRVPPVAAWRRWWIRPRFALEAAYVATALVVVVVGLSASGVEASPARMRERWRQPLDGLERVTATAPAEALSVLRESAGATVAGAEGAFAGVGDGLRTFWRGVASLLESPGETKPASDTDSEETT